MQRKKPR